MTSLSSILGGMNRLIRRLLKKPTTAERYESLGRAMADSFATGLRDPRPLTAEEMDHLMAYAGGVARRSFSALYGDEDDPPVQCWHYEPGSPCDWDICRQPERLAAGDYGTDPAQGAG